MNVLRMIKMFAWESKVKDKMEEKRDEELVWTKKRQFLQLVNMNTKYVERYEFSLFAHSFTAISFRS